MRRSVPQELVKKSRRSSRSKNKTCKHSWKSQLRWVLDPIFHSERCLYGGQRDKTKSISNGPQWTNWKKCQKTFLWNQLSSRLPMYMTMYRLLTVFCLITPNPLFSRIKLLINEKSRFLTFKGIESDLYKLIQMIWVFNLWLSMMQRTKKLRVIILDIAPKERIKCAI